jgi:hypothetical protein
LVIVELRITRAVRPEGALPSPEAEEPLHRTIARTQEVLAQLADELLGVARVSGTPSLVSRDGDDAFARLEAAGLIARVLPNAP